MSRTKAKRSARSRKASSASTRQGWRWPMLVAAALLVTTIALVGLARHSSAATPFFKDFSAENETSQPSVPLTTAIATEQAQGLDLITANSNLYKNYVSALKAGNPAIKLWCYVNASEAQRGQGPNSGVYPSSWYSKQANGYYLRNKSFGNWLMDPSNSSWVSNRIQTAQSCLTNNGYDSVFWDVIGPAPAAWDLYAPTKADGTRVTGVSDKPINPATGQNWTRTNWMQTTGGLVAHSQNSLGRAVGGNGLVSGLEYYNGNGPTSTLYGSGGDNLMAESFLRSATQPASSYPSESVWKQSVNMLVDAGKRGKSLLAYTKVWTNDTQADKDAVHRYALASFLLGSDGNSYFGFRYDKDRVMGYPWWTEVKSIGTPSGAYYQAANTAIYERDFSNGKALVDPTGAAVTVSLPGEFTTLTGETVTSVNFSASNRAAVVFSVPPSQSGGGDASSSPVSTGSTSSGASGSSSTQTDTTLIVAPGKLKHNATVMLDGKPVDSIDTSYLTNGRHTIAVTEDGKTTIRTIEVHNLLPIALRNQLMAHKVVYLAVVSVVLVLGIGGWFGRRPLAGLFMQLPRPKVTA